MKLILLLIKDFIGLRMERLNWFRAWKNKRGSSMNGETDFCGHNKGTFLISGLKSKQVADAKGGMCMEKIELKEQSFYWRGLMRF